jgi:iron complex transport system substrate-binding protein
LEQSLNFKWINSKEMNNSSKFFITIQKFLTFNLAALCIWSIIFQEAHAAPHRIISTSPAITEILFAIGAGDRVVGVTDYCNYPKNACRLPSIGGPLNPNTEKWIALKPDLIILQDDSVVLNKHAKVFKIPTLEVSVNNLKNILRSIQVIADAMQTPKAGKQLANKIKIKIDNYRISLGKTKPHQVLMLLSDTNDPSRDLYAVGRNTFLNELLSIAGGENILPDTMATYPKISKEFIIAKSPEIIIEIGPTANLSNEGILIRKKAWEIYPTIRAVKNDRLYFVGADYILIPGPRLVKILDILTRNIHPKLFSSTANIKQEIISQ